MEGLVERLKTVQGAIACEAAMGAAISAGNYGQYQTLLATLKGLRTEIVLSGARHAGPAKRSRTQLQQLSAPPSKSLRAVTAQPLASFTQYPPGSGPPGSGPPGFGPPGLGFPSAFVPHPISRLVTDPTYDPVTGAVPHPKPNANPNATPPLITRPDIINPTFVRGAAVAHPTYYPVPGANVAQRRNPEAPWTQFNNLAIAEQRLRVSPQPTEKAKEDVRLAAASVRGET